MEKKENHGGAVPRRCCGLAKLPMESVDHLQKHANTYVFNKSLPLACLN